MSGCEFMLMNIDTFDINIWNLIFIEMTDCDYLLNETSNLGTAEGSWSLCNWDKLHTAGSVYVTYVQWLDCRLHSAG